MDARDYENDFYEGNIVLYVDRRERNHAEFWYYDIERDAIWFKHIDTNTGEIIDDEISYTQDFYELWSDKDWLFRPEPISIVEIVFKNSVRFV